MNDFIVYSKLCDTDKVVYNEYLETVAKYVTARWGSRVGSDSGSTFTGCVGCRGTGRLGFIETACEGSGTDRVECNDSGQLVAESSRGIVAGDRCTENRVGFGLVASGAHDGDCGDGNGAGDEGSRECVPVDCSSSDQTGRGQQVGKWYWSNKRKRERYARLRSMRKESGAFGSSSGSSVEGSSGKSRVGSVEGSVDTSVVSGVKGESVVVVSGVKDEVAASLAARRVVENELAVLKAKAQIALVQDPLVRAAREDMGRKKAIVAAAMSAAQYEKQMADLESVSPGSSVSLFEVRALEKEKELLDLKAYRLEQLAREYAPKEAVKSVLEALDGEDEIEFPIGTSGSAGTCGVIRSFEKKVTGPRVDALGCELEEDW